MEFSYFSTENRAVCRLASQASDVSVASVLAGEKLERVKRFQQKAVRAKVVIVLITKDYTGSKTSEQQVISRSFYQKLLASASLSLS